MRLSAIAIFSNSIANLILSSGFIAITFSSYKSNLSILGLAACFSGSPANSSALEYLALSIALVRTFSIVSLDKSEDEAVATFLSTITFTEADFEPDSNNFSILPSRHSQLNSLPS